jgi:hypothetical protein
MKRLGIFDMGFDVTDQLVIRFLHSSNTGERKNGSTIRQCISFLYTSRNPMIHFGGKYFTIFSFSFR